MLQDVLRLVSGTIGGRLIALAAMPLVTRLYSPDDFALLAVYLSMVSMGGAVACLRLDVAIPVARDDRDAANLLVSALIIAVTLTTALFTLVLSAPQAVSGFIEQPNLTPWLWMIPLGILFSANYSILQFWATRSRRFGSIARTRVTQALIGVGAMLGMGFAGIAPLGLLLGNMLTTSAGGLSLGREVLRSQTGLLSQVSLSRMFASFRYHRRFPIYSVPESLANIAGAQVPILIIAYSSATEAGHLLLAQQTMSAPMALLGSSVAQVYLSRAPDEHKAGRLDGFTFNIFKKLAQIGIVPLLIAGAASPFLFPTIFGQQWARAGDIVSWMVPWTVLQFLSSPLSMVMFVTKRQPIMLALTVTGCGLRIGIVWVTLLLRPELLIQAYILASALFYAVCLITFLRSAAVPHRDKNEVVATEA
jgi:O-antigen/teichoic acid export membrane protein